MSKIEKADAKFKNWLQSKTIWGILIALAPIISQMIGFDVSTEVGETYTEIIHIAGSILAIYGRWKANTKVVVGKIKKEV